MKNLLLVLATAFFLFGYNAKSQVNLEDGLIRYYMLDGNMADSSDYEAHGTVQGAEITERHGVPEQAYAFDGLSKTTAPSLGNWGDMLSISYWFKMNTNETFGVHIGSREGTSGATLTNIRSYSQADSTVKFIISSYDNGNIAVESSNKFINDAWNHIICELDLVSQTIKIILNGTESVADYQITPRYLNTSLGIGNFGHPFTANTGTKGKIDEVRIYDRILTADEKAELLNQEFESLYFAEYPLNGNANDVSGNENHGTAYNEIWKENRYMHNNSAFGCDGENDITFPTIGNWGDELCLSVWFKPDSLNPEINVSDIVRSRTSDETNYANFKIRFDHADTTVNFLIWGTNVNHENVISQNKAVFGRWNHVVAAYNKITQEFKIILNNIVTTDNAYLLPRYKNAPIAIGNSPNGFPGETGFYGAIDDFRIFNTVISEDFANELYISRNHFELVADYNFSGDATDLTHNNYHGVVNGATLVPDRFENENSAYYFDGTDNTISISDINLPIDEITVSFWAKTDEEKQQFAFVCEPDDSENRFASHIHYQPTTSNTYWDFGDITIDGRINADIPNLQLEVWEHYIYVSSSSRNYMKIYVNGVLQIEENHSDNHTGDLETLLFGKFYHGILDDIKIFNAALSENEIIDLYFENNIPEITVYGGGGAIDFVSDYFSEITTTAVYNHPTFTDIDNDGLLDLLIGNSDGAVELYEQESENSENFTLINSDFKSVSLQAFPVVTDLDGDGLYDLLIGDYYGHIIHYEQDTENSYDFTLVTEQFNSIETSEGYAYFTVADIDGNNLLDILIGDFLSHKLLHYEQNAENSLEFTQITDYFGSIDFGLYVIPHFTDMDNDGLIDLLVSEYSGKIKHFEQINSSSSDFVEVNDKLADIEIDQNMCATTVDLDNDGLMDIICGDGPRAKLLHFEQINKENAIIFAEIKEGETSNSKSFMVGTKNLVSNLIITAPEGFEISTDNNVFNSNIELETNNGELISKIYTRFIPEHEGIYTENIEISSDYDFNTIMIYGNADTCQTLINISPSECNTYTSPSGNYTWTESGIYQDTIYLYIGCDEIFTINLTINTTDNSVTQNGITLTASETDAEYQWLDCNNGNAPIQGETSQSFTASENGSYAVEITKNDCSAISNCYDITTVETEKISMNNNFTIVPNPASEIININTNMENYRGTIFDITGKILLTIDFNQKTVDLSKLNKGIYFVRIQNSELNKTSKLLIK